jgi:hypothetical protein
VCARDVLDARIHRERKEALKARGMTHGPRTLARAIATFVLALVTIATVATRAAEAQSPIGVRVDVVTQEGGLALAYAVVSAPSQDIERFTDVAGRVVLPLRPGRVQLRVKRLGYVPRDTTVEVTTVPGQAVRVALARVSFNLEAVRVVSWPPCTRPGIPRRGGDSQLRGIVDQVRQNAERYRLLTKMFPFTYDAERAFTRKDDGGPIIPDRTDTISVRSDVAFWYRPGRILMRERDGESEWKMRIPTLSDLADEQFIDSHCFHIAGLEAKRDQRLLRIDIVAAQRISTPDVNVSVWLDPEGFQLRHATFTLVRAFAFPNLLHLVSSADYVEVVPFVPVMHETITENLVRGDSVTSSYIERQTIVRLTFTGARP